ncbi:uncharacterized protein LOC111336840 isoform X1 [Stylophora pistillata]|uniref:uncharacterized protein LOC111336840 isoform X1 n=1 Tax=Stylophora pistillata TaxID=50429 RepID=UPI000C04886D|nr:uncharacterized protein LOC111336840 isoform X1 [Stylophora pistillata]
MMAPYCIPKRRCNTHAVGWISGRHPSEAYELVTAKACFHWNSDCCLWHRPVQIRNCSGYYVYELQEWNHCYHRYCGVKDESEACHVIGGSEKCICQKGYEGNLCGDLDECASGNHDCHKYGVCHNEIGSYTCHCQFGYVGNGTWCEACPEHSEYIETSPNVHECWCKYVYPGEPEVDPCRRQTESDLTNIKDSIAVLIHDADTQPSSPMRFRRDQTRTLVASLKKENFLLQEASFAWKIRKLSLSPFNIYDPPELLVPNTLELNIRPNLLSTGLKVVTFELREVPGSELTALDFAFIEVLNAALEVSIAGGTEVVRSIKRLITVDATSSYDTDNLSAGNSSGLKYNWFCLIITKSNVSRSYTPASNVSFRGLESIYDTLVRAAASGTLFQLPDDVFLRGRERAKVTLDNKKLTRNQTYYVVLTVSKDVRVARGIQIVHVRDGHVLVIRILCTMNCDSPASVSSRNSLRTDCASIRCPVSLKYGWSLLKNNGSNSHPQWSTQIHFKDLLGTKVDSANLVIKEQKLLPGSSYKIKLNVLSPEGSFGSAVYQFDTVASPSGGTCHGAQLDRKDVGSWVNITCQGWKDKHTPLSYEFFRELADGELDMLSYGVWSYSVVYIPPLDEDVVRFKVAVVNSLRAAYTTGFSIKLNQSSWLRAKEVDNSELQARIEKMDTHFELKQTNLAIQEADMLLFLLKMVAKKADEEKDLPQMKNQVISKICEVPIDKLERLVQVAVILKKATKGDALVSHDTTFTVLNKLKEISNRLSLENVQKRSSETRLFLKGARLLLHCTTNIMDSSSSRVLTGSLSANFDKGEEMTMGKTISVRCQELTEMTTNALLSLKLPGEENTTIRNERQTTILGKHESDDLSSFEISDGKASFVFPPLDSRALKTWVGDISDVGVEMMNYNFNPYMTDDSSSRVRSKVVSLVLKDGTGKALNTTVLPSDIEIGIPIPNYDPVNSTRSDHFLNPGRMQYHTITVLEVDTTIKLTITTKTAASIAVYVKFAEQPTEISFDEVIHLSIENRSSSTDCELEGNCSLSIVVEGKYPGEYFVGLLENSESRKKFLRSRGRRSFLPETATQEKCVKFKDPPPAVVPQVEHVIFVPQYDSDRSVNYSLQVETIWCAFWSEAEQIWTNEGCKATRESDHSSLRCLCNHLTAFGGDILVAPNTIDFELVQQAFENVDPSDLLVVITLCSTFLVYFLVLVQARRADKADASKDNPLIPLAAYQNGDYMYEVSITTGGWKNCGTTANVSMILYGTENTSDVVKLTCDIPCNRKLFAEGNTDNFLIRQEMPLGEITSMQIGHDISGEDPSWFISEILTLDCQTGQRLLFSCYRWLALERDDGQTTRRFYADDFKNEDRFKRKFSALLRNGFADDHLWLSVIRKQPRNQFTRAQRASCCWSLFMLSMVTSAMFYETEDIAQRKLQIGPFSLTPSQLVIALESALVVVPASLLIVLLFRKSQLRRNIQGNRYHLVTSKRKVWCLLPHFFVYIAWFLCIGTAITSALFTMFYSFMWGGEKSSRWLTSVLLSFTGEVLVFQPVKIIIASVVLALRHGRGKKSTNKSNPTDASEIVDLSSMDVERVRKYRKNKRRMYAFTKELVFSVTFFVLLLIVCYGDKSRQRYHLRGAIENEALYFDNIGRYKVTNVAQFWGWLEDVFVPAIFSDGSYRDQEEKGLDYTSSDRSTVVGMPRLRQLRVTKDSCVFHQIFKSMFISCYGPFSKNEEEKRTWIGKNSSSVLCPENWEYNGDGGFDTWGRFAVYSGGGYIANLGYNKVNAKRIIKDLKEKYWIDRQTRAVLVEFSLYNPPSNLLAVMTYFFEVLPSGFAGIFKSYGILPLSATNPQAHETYLLFAFLFGILLVFFFIFETIKLCRQSSLYFKSGWNWLNILQILTALSALFLKWMKIKAATKTFFKLKENPFVPISFHDVLLWSDLENLVICIASVTGTLRLLKCFHFMPQIIVFSWTLRRSFSSVSSFFLIFVVVAIGHSFLGVIAFGTNMYMFSSFIEAISSQFLMLLGKNIPANELITTNPILGRFFFFTFVASTTIVIVNTFIATINEHYATSNSDKGVEDLELAEFITDRIIDTLFRQKSNRNQFMAEYENHELFDSEVLLEYSSLGGNTTRTLSPTSHRSRTPEISYKLEAATYESFQLQ